MQIRIKTNESLLVSNGWKVISKHDTSTIYRKWINNKLLEVWYDETRCRIIYLDKIGVKFALESPDDVYICLKDMEVALDELKKLEIEE